jgi:hypothetical protein
MLISYLTGYVGNFSAGLVLVNCDRTYRCIEKGAMPT